MDILMQNKQTSLFLHYLQLQELFYHEWEISFHLKSNKALRILMN